MTLPAVGLLGVGKFLPPKVVANDDFVAMGLDTSDAWITERTGIKERRIADADMATSDLAFEAAKAALAHAGKTAQDIDLIVVATSTPDHPLFPSVACQLQDRLGARSVGAFDVSAACSGFNFALSVGTQAIQTGNANTVLVVSADCLSRFLNWKDRGTCILFGDGAGAVVLGKVQAGYGILATELRSEGQYGSILNVPAGGSKKRLPDQEDESFIYMDGKAVFKVAVHTVVDTVHSILKTAGLSPDQIQLLVPHQANVRIIEKIRETLHLSPEQVMVNIAQYGNTSASSIPIALTEAVEANRIQDGDLVLTIGFGAGFTCAASIIRWGGFL
ncbi:MAG: beta-ketoacyl-ACP synthase III [Candidatus Margulisiibacteriota bacterium]